MGKRHPAGQAAPSRPELLPALLFLLLGLGLMGAAFFKTSIAAYYRPLLFQLSGVLLLAAAGFGVAYLSRLIEMRGPFVKPAPLRIPARPLPRFLDDARRHVWRTLNRLRGADWLGDWLPLAGGVLLALLSLLAYYKGWRTTAPFPPAARLAIIVGVMVGLAFPLLVLERRFSGLAARLPEARALTYLLRLILFTLMTEALVHALLWLGLPFSSLVERIAILFGAAVAAEITLRGLGYIFMPLPLIGARHHAGSLIASLLRLQKPSLKAIQASMNSQFGIDLGRSWALGFIRRATLPMIGGLVLAAWLTTGITTLSISERAVYEAFGSPQRVFHSGLHVYLPWPFGRLKPVEYGVVHQIPVAFLDEEIYGKAMDVKQVVETPTIEGPQPASADRLWEASRPTEASYLVASNQNGRENFEVVNIDLRIAYRIGLTDEAAMSAAYSMQSPDDLIRAAAGRMLARYFARSSLAGVMGQDRDVFIRGFQKELQQRINALTGSVEILSVVIETLHPPAGVAEAYHQVQAAAIDAVTKVANARADAVRDVRQAEADAVEARDGATAAAAETVADAKVGTALLAGDVQAYREGGQAFLFEKRLGILGAAITADTPVTILDARVPANQQQLLQARPPAAQQ